MTFKNGDKVKIIKGEESILCIKPEEQIGEVGTIVQAGKLSITVEFLSTSKMANSWSKNRWHFYPESLSLLNKGE